MAGNRQPPSGERPALQSVRRGWLGGWRLSALVIGALAIGLVYVGRFGLPDLTTAPAASGSPSPTAAAAATPTPIVPATGGPGPSGEPVSAPPPTPAPRATLRPRPAGSADRYPDGIPGHIGGERVLRVPDVTAMEPRDVTQVLVGGWVRDGRLRDAIGAPTADASIRVRGVGVTPGPVVIRGSYSDILLGESIFDASETLWTGDLQTSATPISVSPLLDALVLKFRDTDPLGASPVRLELSRVRLDCPIAWPRYSYAATSGPVLLAFVFSSPADRLVSELAITQSQYPNRSDDVDPGCPHPRARTTGRTRWLVDGNVMLLIRSGPRNTELARQALADARAQSDLLEPLGRPVTTWQAIRALWTVYPGVDVAPPAEEVWCIDGLPQESWSIRHRWVRGMAIFDYAEERERFQATTDPTGVRLEQGACTGLGGQRPIGAEAHWVGAENVLLLVTGPAQIDPLLEAAIPRSRVTSR